MHHVEGRGAEDRRPGARRLWRWLLAGFAEQGCRSRPDRERVLEEVRAAFAAAPERP
jgi:hypothetical protein